MSVTTLPTTRTRRRPPRIRLRDLGPDDGHVVDTVFAGLSDRSRYLRFHAPVHDLPPSMRRALVAVDGRDHVAVAAEVRTGRVWQAIGVGRLVRDGDGRAEIAISVVDAWHGHGIGTRLVRALRSRALSLGVRELVADVLTENEPMLRILRRELPSSHVRLVGDAVRLVSPLTSADDDLGFTADDLVA